MTDNEPLLESIKLTPIGIIHTPFTSRKGMPVQPRGGEGVEGTIVVRPDYTDGLADVENFSHLILLFHLHQATGYSLKVTPFLDDCLRGVFATRAPRRPNPIGLSIVELIKRQKNVLHIRGVDMLDNTPLLDIKPYVPAFDIVQVSSVGWLEGKETEAVTKKADERFKKK